MNLLPNQLYLTYLLKLGNTRFQPTIKVENIDQADTLRAVKMNLAGPGMDYLNFKVIKGPNKEIIKNYNLPDKARLFIDDTILKDHGLGTTKK